MKPTEETPNRKKPWNISRLFRLFVLCGLPVRRPVQGQLMYGDDSVLAERQAVVGMASHLEYELSIPALEHQLAFCRSPDRQATKNKRTRAESETLASLLSFESHQFDAVQLT